MRGRGPRPSAPSKLPHRWQKLGKVDRCDRCGLFRQKTGRIDVTRGDTRHYQYRSKASDWIDLEPVCFDPRQGGLLEQPIDSEVLGAGKEACGKQVEVVAPACNDTNDGSKVDVQVGTVGRSGSYGTVAPASLREIIHFEFDPLGRWGGIEANWRIYVIGPPAASGFEQKVEKDTYPYAEEKAKNLLSYMAKSALISNGVKVIIELDGKLFREWTWRTTKFELTYEGQIDGEGTYHKC